MQNHPPAFFGYGSLVNTNTHTYPSQRTIRLTGWRRVWCHLEGADHAYLSARRDENSAIDGLIASVPEGDWRALDARERGYERHHTGTENVWIYEIPEHPKPAGEAHPPILLSYLDAVVQGYLRQFNEAGALGFFNTTEGWHVPVLNDRAAPRYPRHCQLTPQERSFVDRALKERGTPIREQNA